MKHFYVYNNPYCRLARTPRPPPLALNQCTFSLPISETSPRNGDGEAGKVFFLSSMAIKYYLRVFGLEVARVVSPLGKHRRRSCGVKK